MKTAIKKRIATDAQGREIADYLYEIMDEIKIKGETPELVSARHFLFGRLLFNQNELDRAYKELSYSSTLCVDNGLMEFCELPFWVGKIAEKRNDLGKAKQCFEIALRLSEGNPLFVSSDEILDSILSLQVPNGGN